MEGHESNQGDWALLWFYGTTLSTAMFFETEQAARDHANERLSYGYSAKVCRVILSANVITPTVAWTEVLNDR